MLKLFGDFVGSIIKSTFMSVVMFVIFYSIVTKKFPPDFSQISKTYDSLQEIVKLNKQFAQKQAATNTNNDYEAGPDHNDVSAKDVSELENYYKKQAEFGSRMMGATAALSGGGGSGGASAKTEVTEANAKLDNIQGSGASKAEINELRLAVMRMQTEIDDLKTELHKKK